MLIKKLFVTVLALSCSALASADEVKIGVVSGITGPIAKTTIEGMNMARGYIAMINDQGGINGNKIVLATRDDGYDPKKTPALVEDIIAQDNVAVLVSAAGTANTIALIKSGVLAKHNVPLVGVFSGSDAIRGPGSEDIFHTRASYHDEIMKIASVVSTLGLKRVAVLFQDDGFGASINESITKAAAEYKFDPFLRVAYKPGETDFTAQAKQIVDAHPQAIFLMAVPNAAVQFMKVYDAPSGASQIYTLSFVSSKDLFDAAGDKRARGIAISQVVPNPNAVALPLAKEFQAFLKTSYAQGAASSPVTFEFYLNLRLALAAIKMAGPKPTPEKVMAALKSMHDYRLAGYPIDFTETKRRGSAFLDIAVVGHNGRLSY